MLYLAGDRPPVPRSEALRRWAAVRGTANTAFPAAYGLGQAVGVTPGHEPIETPFTLSTAQQAVVARSQRDPVTVATGLPGPGRPRPPPRWPPTP